MNVVIFQSLVSGISMGFIYALIALEYTIVFNASGVLNMAHGTFITVGAYLFFYVFVTMIGLPYWIAVICTLLVMFFFGMGVSYGLFEKFAKLPFMYSITAVIMFSRIILEVIRLAYGSYPRTLLDWLNGIFRFNKIVVSKANVAIVFVAIVVVIVLNLFMQRTKSGTAMRCVAQNKNAAALMGINVKLNKAVTLGISSVICGVIALLLIPLYGVSANVAGMAALKGFAAGIVGGFGYLPGTIVGGVLLGVVESLSVLVIPASYKDVVAFTFMIVFLLIRPSGLLGHKN